MTFSLYFKFIKKADFTTIKNILKYKFIYILYLIKIN